MSVRQSSRIDLTGSCFDESAVRFMRHCGKAFCDRKMLSYLIRRLSTDSAKRRKGSGMVLDVRKEKCLFAFLFFSLYKTETQSAAASACSSDMDKVTDRTYFVLSGVNGSVVLQHYDHETFYRMLVNVCSPAEEHAELSSAKADDK